LRFVVPGRRGRGSLRGLKRRPAVPAARKAAVLAAACALALVLAGCFASGGRPGGAHRLGIGLTEANPNLIEAPAPGATGPFATAARELAGLHFGYSRLLVSWAAVQPAANRPPDWDVPQDGCLRAPPCAPFAGVRAQLRGLASRRPRPQILVSFLSTPDWAAVAPAGCENGDAGASARAPTPTGLSAYRVMIRSLLALAAQEGVEIKWWSPWNEPNAGYFLGPQRDRCDPHSATRAPASYARMARALKAELDAAPGDQRLVLGDLSAAAQARPQISAVSEWVRALPRDVACDSGTWALHEYVGDADVLGDFAAAIDSRHCPGPRARIWISETGAGGARPGQPRFLGSAALRAGCRAMDQLLREFASDDRVDVAIQYSAREDALFPVGLLAPDLSAAYPALGVWRAWSQRGRDEGPPPLPAACR
jgi:hypothetical protein